MKKCELVKKNLRCGWRVMQAYSSEMYLEKGRKNWGERYLVMPWDQCGQGSKPNKMAWKN